MTDPGALAPGSFERNVVGTERWSGARRCALTWSAALALLASLMTLSVASPAVATEIKLWPLFKYQSAASGERRLDLLGPLFTYETGPERYELSLRPLFSLTHGPRVDERQFTILYPVWISRWDQEQSKHSLLILVNYRSEPARRPDQPDRRFTIFPLVFYRSSRTLGSSLSVLPFYANVRDFLGYERVQMLLFPFYLRLQEPLVARTWMPFPFYGRTTGTLGRGVRVWPFYGWEQVGEESRFQYIMWPFYITQERYFSRPERERRLVVVPFYSHTESPKVESRSYVGPFFTHTIDHVQHTDTWGFPWPLWVSQRDTNTGERTSLRLTPFYENTRAGTVHRHFILWPVYRWLTQDADSYHYRRSDAMLVLYRNIREEQPQYHHTRELHTLFPLYRAEAEDDDREFSSLGLLDALYPRNPTIEQLYGPLWQVYTRRQHGDQPPRWSVLWDLISSEGGQIRYPVHLDLGQNE